MFDSAQFDPTREKLLAAAGPVFAERGFHAATIREIAARAKANVAAVNYHFGDKVGLYTEVLTQSICAAQPDLVSADVRAGMEPEALFRLLIHTFLRRIYGESRPDWQHRLLTHELAQPSPAFKHVLDETIRPRFTVFREVVLGIIGHDPGPEKVRLIVHSIIGQILFYSYVRPVLTYVWPELAMTEDRIRDIANHIAEFSLEYLRSLSNKKKENFA